MHADHRAVYQATMVATRPINSCPIRRLLCYEVLSETEWASPFGNDAFIPTVFVDISEYLDRKLKAVACYRSQLKQPPHSRSLQAIEALARLRGSTVSLQAAEAFMLVREIVE
jgi:LmbE family N-acetylglucosaminyl deacetylase